MFAFMTMSQTAPPSNNNNQGAPSLFAGLSSNDIKPKPEPFIAQEISNEDLMLTN
jgi:hypothetical protein